MQQKKCLEVMQKRQFLEIPLAVAAQEAKPIRSCRTFGAADQEARLTFQ
jgi:hypothetical protein